MKVISLSHLLSLSVMFAAASARVLDGQAPAQNCQDDAFRPVIEQRVYPLHSLLDGAASWSPAPLRHSGSHEQNQYFRAFKRQAMAEEVGDLLERFVDTDSWTDNGGTRGAYRLIGERLLVAQTAQAHRQITQLLGDLAGEANPPAGRPANPPAEPSARPPAKPDPLAARVAGIDFWSTPFDMAIEVLEEKTHANIVVNWKDLEGAGVSKDTLINVRLVEVPLATALSVILDLATGEQAKLVFRAEESGVIRISTAEVLSRDGVTRIYNIRDLIEADINFLRTHGRIPANLQQVSYQDIVDAIARIIEDAIDTDSWKDNGGSVGCLREFGGLLIVTNTPESHQKLKMLLDKLRYNLPGVADLNRR